MEENIAIYATPLTEMEYNITAQSTRRNRWSARELVWMEIMKRHCGVIV
jgi:hypothetical protein